MDKLTTNDKITKIRAIYKELLQEPNVRYVPRSGFTRIIEPDNISYCSKAEELIELAVDLSNSMQSILPQSMGSFRNNNLALLKSFVHDKEKKGNITSKSKERLVSLMKNANSQLMIDLHEILHE